MKVDRKTVGIGLVREGRGKKGNFQGGGGKRKGGTLLEREGVKLRKFQRAHQWGRRKEKVFGRRCLRDRSVSDAGQLRY